MALNIFTIVLVYRFVRAELGDASALFVTAAMAFSPMEVFYSVELRCYSLVMFLVVLSVISHISLLRHYRVRDALIYGMASIALLYTHYLTYLIVGIHAVIAVCVLVKTRPPLRPLALIVAANVLVGAAGMLQVPEIIEKFKTYEINSAQYLPAFDPLSLVHAFIFDLPGGPVVGQGPYTVYGKLMSYLFAVYFASVCVACFLSRAGVPSRTSGFFVVYSSVMCVAFVYIAWFIHAVGLANVFYSHRTPASVHPLFVIALTGCLFRVNTAMLRNILKTIYIVLILPALYFSAHDRIAYLDDFNRPIEQAKDLGINVIYMLDEPLAPWVNSTIPEFEFKSLSDAEYLHQETYLLLMHKVLDFGLRNSDEENKYRKVIEYLDEIGVNPLGLGPGLVFPLERQHFERIKELE